MKKYCISFLLISTLYPLSLFAYSSTDIENANSLADEGIIVDHRNDVAAYRFDDTISRQEVAGIAIKMMGISLPDNYVCQGYYSDIYFPVGHTDAWVCRSVEMAADNYLISRENTTFRPKNNITRAEALAMVMKAKNIEYPKKVTSTLEGLSTSVVYPAGTPQWHIDLIEGAKTADILVFDENENPYNTFSPNRLATRADIFGYVYDVLHSNDISGTFTYEEGSNVAVYINAAEDFEISMPKDYRIYQEEVKNDTFIQDVYGIKVDKDDIMIASAIVGHESCSVCDTTELAFMKEGSEFGSGTIKQKISDTLYIVDGQSKYTKTQSYIRYVFHPKTKTLYYVLATTATDDWNMNKKELLTIVNSLKVYK